MLNLLFEKAEKAQKHDWHTYELFKEAIIDAVETVGEYESAIKKLTEILEV